MNFWPEATRAKAFGVVVAFVRKQREAVTQLYQALHVRMVEIKGRPDAVLRLDCAPERTILFDPRELRLLIFVEMSNPLCMFPVEAVDRTYVPVGVKMQKDSVVIGRGHIQLRGGAYIISPPLPASMRLCFRM